MESSPTLKSLINSAEGFLDEAILGRISIIRTLDNLRLKNIAVNYESILSGEAEDIELSRLDQVVVSSKYDISEDAYIKVYGAINNPDAEEGIELPYINNMTLEDVLIRVGGVSEAASLTRVEIVRRKRNVDLSKANAQISENISLTVDPNLLVSTSQEKNYLQPFDEIFVRKSPNYEIQTYASVEGEVFYPDKYGIENKEERISDLLKRAGGLTLQAYIPGATLIRTVQLSEQEMERRRRTLRDLAQTNDPTQTIDVEEVEQEIEESIGIDLERILRNPGSSEDLILQDGDILKIPKTLQTVRIQGEVLYPTTVRFARNFTFKDYISGSGGFTKQSFKRKSYVLYPNGSVDRTRKFLVFNIYPRVEPGSEIIVPEKNQNGAEQLNGLANVLGTVSYALGTLFSIYGLISLNK